MIRVAPILLAAPLVGCKSLDAVGPLIERPPVVKFDGPVADAVSAGILAVGGFDHAVLLLGGAFVVLLIVAAVFRRRSK